MKEISATLGRSINHGDCDYSCELVLPIISAALKTCNSKIKVFGMITELSPSQTHKALRSTLRLPIDIHMGLTPRALYKTLNHNRSPELGYILLKTVEVSTMTDQYSFMHSLDHVVSTLEVLLNMMPNIEDLQFGSESLEQEIPPVFIIA